MHARSSNVFNPKARETSFLKRIQLTKSNVQQRYLASIEQRECSIEALISRILSGMQHFIPTAQGFQRDCRFFQTNSRNQATKLEAIGIKFQEVMNFTHLE